uniref:Peptidase S1 domain-containing protein n=1 Tax=Pseudictyota dubia TaxID=2749911 RepID=A0A7R9W7W1_9STRA|mmetsp:Transcript_36792/g.68130  ORF Transcript_36792/g.68130 Transcript_36792/m.68130 type:complete len:337 (+) Transcript_36792:600-1610(+)
MSGRELVLLGQNAKEGDYPFFVHFGSGDGEVNCGGSLIAADMVLTAGHCKVETGKTKAYVGRHKLKNDENEEIFGIVNVVRHPEFKDEKGVMGVQSATHDQMIVFLDGTSEMDVVRINQEPAIPNNGTDLDVVGFGRYVPDDPTGSNNILGKVEETAPILQETGGQVYLDSDVCKDTLDKWNFTGETISDDMFCVQEKASGACGGDSGGPVLLKQNGEPDLLVGIVSGGKTGNCIWVATRNQDPAYAQHYSQYPRRIGTCSRVSYTSNWISEQVCINSMDPPSYFNCDGITHAPTSTSSPTASTFSPTPSPASGTTVGLGVSPILGVLLVYTVLSK